MITILSSQLLPAASGEAATTGTCSRGASNDLKSLGNPNALPNPPGGSLGAAETGTEFVQRVMSRAGVVATRETGLLRGGRDGKHFVTDAANSTATRAQSRLALAERPEVRTTMEVPAGRFSPPSRVGPLHVGRRQGSARWRYGTYCERANPSSKFLR